MASSIENNTIHIIVRISNIQSHFFLKNIILELSAIIE